MRVPFRQGLLSFQKVSSTPTFLQIATANSSFVSHVVEPTPTVVTFAHGASDYLQVFAVGTDLAWGPILTSTTYLFWDMDRFSGEVTRGITTLEPITSLITPQNPVNGQNWFDLNVNKMKVWKSNTSAWAEVIRVFAGRVTGTTITMYAEGTQVGLNTPVTAGYLMLDTLLNPLRKSSGEFLTDSEPSYVKTTVSTSGVLVQPVNKVITVKAGEAIPRMSLVYFSAADTVRPASSNPALIPTRVPVGIVMDQLNVGDQGTVVVGGEISYDQWDWSATPGAALYATTSGQLSTTRPAGLLAYRVGFIKNANTIIFNVDAETTPQVYTADENALIIAGIDPVVTTSSVNGIGERVVTVAVNEANNTLPGLLSAPHFQLLNQVGARLDTVETNIDVLELSKANVVHSHTIPDVTGLQTALNQKADVAHTHLAAQVTDLQPLLNAKANMVHSHTIPDVTGLQTALNQKAFAEHLNEFDEIFQTVTRVPGSADVGSGLTLASALAAKANVAHTHIISDVTGLQTELSNRAFVVHTHTISNVTGLQTELNARAPIIHTHVIADVTGLSAALAIKSDVGHTHIAANVTDFSEAVDDRVASLIVAGANITTSYNDAAGTLTISSTGGGGGGGADLLTTSTSMVPDPVVVQLFDFNRYSPELVYASPDPAYDPWASSIEGGAPLTPPAVGYSIAELGLYGYGTMLSLNGVANPSPINFPVPAPSTVWSVDFYIFRYSQWLAPWVAGHERVFTVNAGTPQVIIATIHERTPEDYALRIQWGLNASIFTELPIPYNTVYEISFEINSDTLEGVIHLNGNGYSSFSTMFLEIDQGFLIPWAMQMGVAGTTVHPLPTVMIDNYRLMSKARFGGQFTTYSPVIHEMEFIPTINTDLTTSSITFGSGIISSILSGAGTPASPASILVTTAAKLDDLTDVQLRPPAQIHDNSVLKYDLPTQKWVDGRLLVEELANVSSYYTPDNGSVLTFVSSGDTSGDPLLAGSWTAQPLPVKPPFVKTFGQVYGVMSPYEVPPNNYIGFNQFAQPLPVVPDQRWPRPWPVIDWLGDVYAEYTPREIPLQSEEEAGRLLVSIGRTGYYKFNIRSAISLINSGSGSNTGCLLIGMREANTQKVIGTYTIHDTLTYNEKELMFGDGSEFRQELNITWDTEVIVPQYSSTSYEFYMYNTFASANVANFVELTMESTQLTVIALTLEDGNAPVQMLD